MGIITWLRTFLGHLCSPRSPPGQEGEGGDDREEEEIEELVALDII